MIGSHTLHTYIVCVYATSVFGRQTQRREVTHAGFLPGKLPSVVTIGIHIMYDPGRCRCMLHLRTLRVCSAYRYAMQYAQTQHHRRSITDAACIGSLSVRALPTSNARYTPGSHITQA